MRISPGVNAIFRLGGVAAMVTKDWFFPAKVKDESRHFRRQNVTIATWATRIERTHRRRYLKRALSARRHFAARCSSRRSRALAIVQARAVATKLHELGAEFAPRAMQHHTGVSGRQAERIRGVGDGLALQFDPPDQLRLLRL